MMKRTLTMIALAVLSVGLLGSCSKINERLDNLEKEVSGIENEQIASINSQIDGIKTSIADLGTIRSDISSLKQSASDHSVDIFNLEEADRALKDRIVNLEDYVDAVLPNYAEKEWVEATFSTLEQYEATCDTIAKIDARIGALDAKLSKDIKACADSLTKWVNKTFEGYYTAAEMDAKLAQMKADIDSSKASGKITDAKVDSIATELTNAKAAVDTAKANIRKEYRAAIDTAIKTSEGKLTKALQEKISDVNGKIESLTTRVGNLETSVADLKGRVDKLEEMIQSVVIVPAYSDGSVRAEDDTLYLDCIIGPASTVSSLTKTNFTVLVNKVLTKAVNINAISITDDKWFSKNPSNGTVSLKIPVKNYIPASDDSTITVALKVNYVHSANLASDYTTEFVPVYVAPAPVAPEGFVYLGVKDANGKPLYWAEKNLGATNPEDYGKYFSWGDVTGQTPSGSTFSPGFSWSNAPFNGGQSSYSETEFNKFKDAACPNGILASTYDAATKTNSSWRTPTKDEFVALAANCVWIWTADYNSTGKAGYIVYKAKNDADKGKANMKGTWKKWDVSKSMYVTEGASEATGYTTFDTHIFFPAAGYGDGTGISYAGDRGYYWSSSLKTDNPSNAYHLIFKSDNVTPQSIDGRYGGYTVRPVTSGAAPAPTPTEPDFVVMKMGSDQSKELKWAKMNLGATTVAGSYTTCYGDLYQWGSVNTLYDGFPWTTATTGSFTWKTGKEGGFGEANREYTGTDATLPDANDVVKQTIGGGWRMPTTEEFKALYDACGGTGTPKTGGSTSTTEKGVYWCDNYDGVKGLLFCDGINKLFFPAAGHSNGNLCSDGGDNGYYWSSTCYSSDDAYDLYFGSGFVYQASGRRYNGWSVRPVSD